MENFKKEIITPVGSDKVIIKTALTGAEREKIEVAQMPFVQAKSATEFTLTDPVQAALAQKHMLLKLCVVSINGDQANCFERLQKMNEHDYKFVLDTIHAEQKKMMPSISPASS